MTWIPPDPWSLTGSWLNYVEESMPLNSYIILPFLLNPTLCFMVCHIQSFYSHIFNPSKEWLWSCIPFSFSEQSTIFSLWYSLPTLFLNVPQCSVCLSLPHFSTKHSSSLSQALVSLFLTHTYGKNYRHDSDWGSCPMAASHSDNENRVGWECMCVLYLCKCESFIVNI